MNQFFLLLSLIVLSLPVNPDCIRATQEGNLQKFTGLGTYQLSKESERSKIHTEIRSYIDYRGKSKKIVHFRGGGKSIKDQSQVKIDLNDFEIVVWGEGGLCLSKVEQKK